jgi:multiple sugar transport system ATP-binding protein
MSELAMANIVLENVTKCFGKVKAVDDVSLSVKDKEFLTLLGPSGCGKTTTLRLIAGLENPDKGNTYIGDKLVNDLSPKDRNVAMVFQSYALYPHMSVFDNIAFPLKLRKISKTEISKRVKEVAELLRIEGLLERKPRELSGGQRQRVALGRAMIRQPNVFLMDEPLSNLDARLRIQMRVELKKLQKDIGVTTVYVTHDQIEAMTMSDRIALMNDGKVMQVGTSEQVYSSPANIWVAGFIGSPPMNFIDCSLEVKNGETYLVHEDFQLPLSGDVVDIVKEKVESQEIVLGFRPEDLLVILKREDNAIKAKVFALEPMGDALIVNLFIGDSLVKARARADLKLKLESDIYLKIMLDKIHIFDKKSGQAIL